MSAYESHFVQLPVEKLIKIIDNASNYDPAALAAAQQELNNRNISAEKITAIRNSRSVASLKKNAGRQKIVDSKLAAEARIKNAADAFHPLTPKSPKTIINLIAFCLGLYGLLQLISNFQYLKFVLQDQFSDDWSWFETFILLSVFIFLLAGVGLYLRKRTGWMLAVAAMFWSVYQFIWNSLVFWDRGLLLMLLFILVFVLPTTVYLCKEKVREEFGILPVHIVVAILLPMPLLFFNRMLLL